MEDRHLSPMALLTQAPGTQNAFDPILMVFGMLTEKREERYKEKIRLLQKHSNWIYRFMTLSLHVTHM